MGVLDSLWIGAVRELKAQLGEEKGRHRDATEDSIGSRRIKPQRRAETPGCKPELTGAWISRRPRWEKRYRRYESPDIPCRTKKAVQEHKKRFEEIGLGKITNWSTRLADDMCIYRRPRKFRLRRFPFVRSLRPCVASEESCRFKMPYISSLLS